MRTSHLVSLFAVLSITACVPFAGSITVSDRRESPSYIYRYGDGSCWADDLWYASCPWYSGPQIGYYHYRYGAYCWEPGFVWGFRIGQPPPWYWQRQRHHRHQPPHMKDPPHRRWR